MLSQIFVYSAITSHIIRGVRFLIVIVKSNVDLYCCEARFFLACTYAELFQDLPVLPTYTKDICGVHLKYSLCAHKAYICEVHPASYLYDYQIGGYYTDTDVCSSGATDVEGGEMIYVSE